MRRGLICALSGVLLFSSLFPMTACAEKIGEVSVKSHFNKVTAQEFVDGMELLIRKYGYDKGDTFKRDCVFKRYEYRWSKTVYTQADGKVTSVEEEYMEKSSANCDRDNLRAESYEESRDYCHDTSGSYTERDERETEHIFAEQKDEQVYFFNVDTKTYDLDEQGGLFGKNEYDASETFQQVLLVRTLSGGEEGYQHYLDRDLLTVEAVIEENADYGSSYTFFAQIVFGKNEFSCIHRITSISKSEKNGTVTEQETVTESAYKVKFKDVTVKQQDISKYTKED